MGAKKYLGEVKDFNFTSFTSSQPSATFEFKNFSLESSSDQDAKIKQEHDFAKRDGFSIIPEVKHHRGHAQHEEDLFYKRLDSEVATKIDQIKKLAFEQAYNEGLSKAKETIEQQFLKNFEQQVSDLTAFVEFVKSHQEKILENNRREVLKIIQSVCHWVLQKEVDVTYAERIIPLMLSKVQGTSKIVLKVDPKSYEHLKGANELILTKFESFKDFKVIPDEHITFPGVVVESEASILDATQESLKKIIDDLFNTLTESANGTSSSEN